MRLVLKLRTKGVLKFIICRFNDFLKEVELSAA